jgi:ribulose-phosphate 3-epimerase
MIKIAPSILSADFGRLADQINMVEEAGAHIIHIDVMDGHFVPNLTYGPLIIQACKRLTSLPLDVHLMIGNAEETLDIYIDAGADFISVHQEAVIHLQRTLSYLRNRNVRAGVALNPATPVETLHWVTAELDFVLIMTVNPGFEAQAFIPQSLDKVRMMKELLDKHGSGAEIEVDGGVGPGNAAQLVEAGASMLVAGSAIFKAPSPDEVIRAMANAGQ